jgi:hypothetical protein
LGRCAAGFVKNDKVQDLAGGDAFADVPLHFGNAGGLVCNFRSFPRKRESRARS